MIVVADVRDCISTTEDVCVCEHVSTWRQGAGHIFLAALLPYSQMCMHMYLGVACLLECVYVLAYVRFFSSFFCTRVRARAQETSRGVNLFK